MRGRGCHLNEERRNWPFANTFFPAPTFFCNRTPHRARPFSVLYVLLFPYAKFFFATFGGISYSFTVRFFCIVRCFILNWEDCISNCHSLFSDSEKWPKKVTQPRCFAIFLCSLKDLLVGTWTGFTQLEHHHDYFLVRAVEKLGCRTEKIFVLTFVTHTLSRIAHIAHFNQCHFLACPNMRLLEKFLSWSVSSSF